MKCDVVIKTWFNDLGWLNYCLRFLARNWLAKDSRTIVLADENCRPVIETWHLTKEEVFYVKPWADGYSHAMVTKTTADEYSDAELILLLDSDVMVTKALTPEALMSNGRPIIRYLDYDTFETQFPHAPWRKVVQSLFLTNPLFYYTFVPALYWRSSFQAMRRYLARLHHRNFLDLTFSDVPFKPENFGHHPISFADHESMGFYCRLAEPERYVFKPNSDRFRYWGKAYHSWTEWNDKTQVELERLLCEILIKPPR
jgi:hypothetical protein